MSCMIAEAGFGRQRRSRHEGRRRPDAAIGLETENPCPRAERRPGPAADRRFGGKVPLQAAGEGCLVAFEIFRVATACSRRPVALATLPLMPRPASSRRPPRITQGRPINWCGSVPQIGPTQRACRPSRVVACPTLISTSSL